jgi:hypothetical protein
MDAGMNTSTFTPTFTAQELESWRMVHEGSVELALLLCLLIRHAAFQSGHAASADTLLQGLLLLPRGRPHALQALQAMVLYANGNLHEAAELARSQEHPLFKVVALLCALSQGGSWKPLLQELQQSEDAGIRAMVCPLTELLETRATAPGPSPCAIRAVSPITWGAY